MTSVTVITGGSRGIGAATAQLAALHGHAVAVGHRGGREAAMQVVERIESAGGSALAVQADVAVEDEVVALFRQVDERLGPVMGLVNYHRGAAGCGRGTLAVPSQRVAHGRGTAASTGRRIPG